MYYVRKPFMAEQFPRGPKLAIGIKFIALQGKKRHEFIIQDNPEKMVYSVDVEKAIAYAKKYPPPRGHQDWDVFFLAKGKMVIVPLNICKKEKPRQATLF